MTLLPLLLTLTIAQQTPNQDPPRSLSAMQDHYRPVLIFAPTGDPRLQQQLHSLAAHPADLLDRQIMLIPFVHRYAGQVDPRIITLLTKEEPTLRHRFHIAPTDFAVILVGKDGGEKLRSLTPVSMDQLNGLIDSMPMRRQERKTRPSP